MSGVEVKASATVKDADFTAGVLVNLGRRAYRYEDRLYVVPMDRLWTPRAN